jgi:hypothetical protein
MRIARRYARARAKPQLAGPALLLRHIGNIFRFSSNDFAQCLLWDSPLSIGRAGDEGFFRAKLRKSLE